MSYPFPEPTQPAASRGAVLASYLDFFRARVLEKVGGLDEVGAPGERWEGAPPATLERVLLHLVQEYARHLGQLDVAVELAGGDLGE